jgi:hypothetical protein
MISKPIGIDQQPCLNLDARRGTAKNAAAILSGTFAML